MSLETDFRAILIGHAPLIALVPATRIYSAVYKQGSGSPAIRYTVIDDATGLHMQGSDGLSTTLMQVDIRAKFVDNISAFEQVTAIRDVLVGSHGKGGLLHPFRGIEGATDFRLIQKRSVLGVRHETNGAEEFYTCSIDFDLHSRAA